MTQKSATSLARIAMLIVLVLAATMGGRHAVSTQMSSSTPDSSEAEIPAVPTEEPLFDLTGTETPEQTAEATGPTEEAAQPTAEQTEAVVEAPTQEPVQEGRGSFPVPENTTGRSIVIERGPEDKQWVALTFDAGEGAGYTEQILDLLKEHNLRASFGITGEWARQYPDLVNRILDEGHLMFNHSESHRSWTGASPQTALLTDDERTEQVMGAHNAVEDVADWDMAPFWRPPYGDLDAEGQELLATLGYDYTFWWTCDTLAWMGTPANEIAAKCASDTDFGGPGAIILMHVAQEQDYLALEDLIADYSSEGYEFVTLDKMIGD